MTVMWDLHYHNYILVYTLKLKENKNTTNKKVTKSGQKQEEIWPLKVHYTKKWKKNCKKNKKEELNIVHKTFKELIITT